MAPYGTNAIFLKALKRNAWDLGLYSQMQACWGTEGCSKNQSTYLINIPKIKAHRTQQNHYAFYEDQSVNVVEGNNR
jgi:hypothetical protein